jgi:hypothetical protein
MILNMIFLRLLILDVQEQDNSQMKNNFMTFYLFFNYDII